LNLEATIVSTMCSRKRTGRKWREESIISPRYAKRGESEMDTGALVTVHVSPAS
jgi:hypothetical protein